MKVGALVVLSDGRQGEVSSVFRDKTGCGCLMIIVRLPSGRDWLGRASEVRLA